MAKRASEQPGFPPPPWHLRGRGWAGLFPTESPIELPTGWLPALGVEAVVVVNRYRAPLAYDELVLGAAAMHGLHVALWVSAIWVSSEAGMEGGRQIWSLPKQLADFTWSEDLLSVGDAQGEIATLQLPAKRALAPAPLRMPVLSRDAEGLLLTRAHGWGRLARAELRLLGAARLPLRPGQRARLGFSIADFRVTFPAPERFGSHGVSAER